MGNWIPNDPTLVAQILKISSSYSPPLPEGFIGPMTWGIENNVIERFAGAGGFLALGSELMPSCRSASPYYWSSLVCATARLASSMAERF